MHHNYNCMSSLAGNRLHLRNYRGGPYDSRTRLHRLANGRGLAAGTVRALHRGGRGAPATVQPAGSPRVLQQPRRVLY